MSILAKNTYSAHHLESAARALISADKAGRLPEQWIFQEYRTYRRLLVERYGESALAYVPSHAEADALMQRKERWGYFWLDMASYEHNDNTLGPMARPRVAYLLRAARSRQDSIERLASGYVVGGTLELVKGGVSGDRMRHLLEKHGC